MTRFEATTSDEAGHVRVALAGECDLAVREELTAALLAAVRRAPVVVVDVGELDFLDSSGVHGLIMAYHAALGSGKRLFVVNPRGSVATVLDLTGVTGLLSPPDGESLPSSPPAGDARPLGTRQGEARRQASLGGAGRLQGGSAGDARVLDASEGEARVQGASEGEGRRPGLSGGSGRRPGGSEGEARVQGASEGESRRQSPPEGDGRFLSPPAGDGAQG
jgi:anti-anti-sigma factor